MTLFSIDSRMVEEPAELFSYLKESGLTFWVSTPSFAELCVQSRDFCMETLPQLTQFLFCGEVLTHTLCDALAERFPHARVINTYGPTEATVLVTAVEVTDGMRADSRPIPIGRAIDGVTLRLQPVPEEEPGVGQLLILGDSVSLGYWKAPALTEGAFFTDPETGLRGYRTGDLCRCEDGIYYYCGRMDNQLKLNGFRVELEDIEHNLQKLPQILRAAVVPVWQGQKVEYLAAFVLLSDSGQQELSSLSPLRRSILFKKLAAQLLPGYMIPRKFFVVDSFPLNLNGKVDKKELLRRLQEGLA